MPILRSAAVPAWVVAIVAVQRTECGLGSCDDNWAVAVAVADVVGVGVAACDGNCDYCEYDCCY